MTEAPITTLRRRMIEDMTIRKFAPRTQEGYIRAVKGFSSFFGASPDRASFEDLRRYQLHLVASGAGTPTINHTVTALRFLFIVTLRKPQLVARLPFIRQPRKLPIVLSPEEVARLLDAAPSLKYKAALSVAYGAGLRASEIISLKIEDIDSTRMVIRVEQGKGRKDRYVMLSPYLLDLLAAASVRDCQYDIIARNKLCRRVAGVCSPLHVSHLQRAADRHCITSVQGQIQ